MLTMTHHMESRTQHHQRPDEGGRLWRADRIRNTGRAARFAASMRRWLPQSRFAGRQAQNREAMERRAANMRRQRVANPADISNAAAITMQFSVVRLTIPFNRSIPDLLHAAAVPPRVD
jgi:hypothetical protein